MLERLLRRLFEYRWVEAIACYYCGSWPCECSLWQKLIRKLRREQAPY